MSCFWPIIIVIILMLLFSFWFVGRYNNNIIVPKNYPIQHMQQVTDKRHTLYFFYNQSCPYCTNFKSVWSNLVSMMQNSSIDFIDVDCNDPANERLCFYYDIVKVPKLILVTPTNHVEYNGNRTVEDIQNFINSNI